MNLSVELGPESLLGQVSFVDIGPGSFTLNKSLIRVQKLGEFIVSDEHTSLYFG